VIDHPEAEGNYTETSGSAMIAYSLLKGVRIGVLDAEKYLPIALDVFEKLVANKLRTEEDGVVRLTDICWVARLGPDQNSERDGYRAYYLSEPKKFDDRQGVWAFIKAYSE
jgi:Predicted unsaturated glucuronyl hydrolase involved in regulation of bacterial surface properties, and related proteins